MGKLESTSTSILDRDLSWPYQEILAEAFLVLWIATKISVELSRQFFPEWRETRIDPEVAIDPVQNMQLEKRLSRLFLGADPASCFWNRATSFWTQYDNGQCHNRSLPLPQPDASKLTIGYYGLCAMLFATAILYIFFFCSLFINRHWKLPFWRSSYLDKIDNFFTPDKERQARIESETLTWLSFILFFPVGVLMFAAFGTFAIATATGWLVLFVWPVVIVAIVAAHATVAVLGDEAVFPCWVIITSIMTTYCTGRICGVWMKDCYSNRIMARIWKIRSEETVEYVAQPSTALTDRYKDSDISWILKFFLGSFSIWATVWPFVGRHFPSVFTYLPFEGITIANDCLRISSSTKSLDRTDALLSYWVDANDLFNNTTNISSPEVSPLSQAIGRVDLAWNVVLIVASSCPVYLFFLIGIGMVLHIIYEVCLYCFQAFRRKNDTNSTLTKGDAERPTYYNSTAGYPTSSGYPEGPLDSLRGLFAIIRNLLTWHILVSLAPEFFLPERYQLPGVLLLTSCFTVWLYRLAIPGFIATWRSHTRDRSRLRRSLWCPKQGTVTEKKDYRHVFRRLSI